MPIIDLFLERVKFEEPDNDHPLPVAEAWDGVKWTVDIQIRTRNYDIDGTGVDLNLDKARNKALQRIRKTKTMYERYGVVPT